jgi:hypothetical protein
MKQLYVDDERECPKGWDLARKYEDAIRMLTETNYDTVSLDHDLGNWMYQDEKTGMTILTWLEERHHNNGYIPFILIHTGNSAVRRTMEMVARKLNFGAE